MKTVLQWLRNQWARFVMWRRVREILRTCGCVTWCPKCREPLNDNSYWLASNVDPSDCGSRGTYKCRKCGQVSEWHFGIAPVPVLLHPK